MQPTARPLRTETKSVKHVFVMEERNAIGDNLARAIAGLRGTQAEFDQVKAGYKARTTEGEARIDNLSTALMNGFEMRQSDCVVVYHPEQKQKHYYLLADWEYAEKNKTVPGAPAII